MKGLIKRYLQFIWHYGQAYSLLTVPLSGFSIALSGFTFLAVAFGIRLTWWEYVLFFITVIIVLSFVGFLLSKAGLISFYQSLNNKQSPELLEILASVHRIELRDGKDVLK